jgi:hypothetical protein
MHSHVKRPLLLSVIFNVFVTVTSTTGIPGSQEILVRATDCHIEAKHGNFAYVDREGDREVLVSTDAAGNPLHAVGDIQFSFPGMVSNGTYRLTVRWRTGGVEGTPWAYRLGSRSGRVVENGTVSGAWHDFYPGQAGRHGGQAFVEDLAGPEPIGSARYVNRAAGSSLTVDGVGKGDFYVRIWDMSPSRNNYFAIESFTLTPVPAPSNSVQAASAPPSEVAAPLGEAFTIGAYYYTQSKEDAFGWDYAFMDLARIGCNRLVVSGPIWSDSAATMKNWGMTAITAYSQLINYPGPGEWPDALMTNNILETVTRLDGMVMDGRPVGDVVVGHIMIDEPECREHPEDEINYLRHWADLYHRHNPGREVYVNHCDPPWIDFHEKRASCSANGTIIANGHRVTDRIAAARSIGLPNFTLVSLQGYMHAWATGGGATDGCKSFEYWGLDPCEGVREWAAARTHHQDTYEMMLVAYLFGSDGYQPYIYNTPYGSSIVDTNGNDNQGIRAAFGAAAHDIRRSHGWPGVDLKNNGEEFSDRGDYPPGPITLTAEAESASSTISKVVFGKSVNGGVTWESVEDTLAPYAATFTTTNVTGRQTVIFRARAHDADGRKSIFDANLIRITD